MIHELITRQDDFSIFKKYNHAFERYADDGIIDIDKRIKHKIDFLVHRLEHIIPKTNGFVPPFRQTPYCIVFVKTGSGNKNIGQFSLQIKKNTVFIIPSRVISSTLYHSLKTSGYLLLFDIDFFLKTELPQHCIVNRKIFKSTTRPYLYLDDDHAEALTEIFEKMLSEQEIDDQERREMMAVKILELCMYCDRLFYNAKLTGNTSIHHPVIAKFTNLLEFNYTSIRSVREYAEMLNLHPNHLNFLLKKHNGLNAKQIINNRIITESKYLLSNSTFIIKEVANHMGFDDPNNFSTFFHKCTGDSPIAYRITCPVFNNQNLKHPLQG
jgi:AraC family transcriptional activator of pobA